MKKLLGISAIAMLAVAPAFADPVAGEPTHLASGTTITNNTPDPEYALAQAADSDGNFASAGYVKGAYNSAIKAINKVDANLKNSLATSGGNGIVKNGTTMNVDLTANGGLELNGDTDGSKTLGVKVGNGIEKDSTTGALKVKAADSGISVTSSGVSVGLTDNKGLTKDLSGTLEVKNGNGIELGSSGVAVKAATNQGITVDSTGVAVNYDNSTIDINSSTNKLEVKDGGLTVGKMATTAVSTGSSQGADNTKLTTQGYVDDAITGLNIGDYATKTGVDNTIKNVTLSQGAVTQGIGGAIGKTPQTLVLMTNWSDETSTGQQTVSYIEDVDNGTLTTAVSVAAPTINTSSVNYATANTTPSNPS